MDKEKEEREKQGSGRSRGPDGFTCKEVGPDDPIDGIKARDWASYVGPSSIYYMMQFFRMQETRRKAVISFSAFFLGPFYFFYRKMWKQGVLFALLDFIVTLPSLLYLMAVSGAEWMVGMPFLRLIPTAMQVCYVLNFIQMVIRGLFAVYWYKKESERRIHRVYDRCPEGPQRSDALAATGGTSWAAVFIYLGVYIEPGVTVTCKSDVKVPVEIVVLGNLYCMGTAEKPVTITSDTKKPADWGGIICGYNSEEVVLNHVDLSYAGATPTESSVSFQNKLFKTTLDGGVPAFHFCNVNGKFVVADCFFHDVYNDQTYFTGGQGVIYNTIFADSGNAADGGEAINVKAGCKLDIANNVIYNWQKIRVGVGQRDKNNVQHLCLYRGRHIQLH